MIAVLQYWYAMFKNLDIAWFTILQGHDFKYNFLCRKMPSTVWLHIAPLVELFGP